MTIVTKLSKQMINHEEVPLINLHDPSITWFCEVTLQIKYNIPPFAQDQ